jgi:hypothetical protein
MKPSGKIGFEHFFKLASWTDGNSDEKLLGEVSRFVRVVPCVRLGRFRCMRS